MDANQSLDKLYYSISEVAELLDINASNIRFWEKEFNSFIKPKKNRNGKRMFTASDIEVLKHIQFLTKEKGYTLSGAKKIMISEKKNIEKNVHLTETLTGIRSFLVELKKELNSDSDASEE